MGLVRERLRTRAAGDEGVTLVEVMVAMFIFALLSVGMVQTMLSVLSVTRDSRARQVALNLAAQEVDRAREMGDVFSVLSEDLPDVTLNGDVFHVHRETQWVSDPAVDLECGAGGGALRYKRVNVTVTWDNMRPSTQPVRSDTILDPGTPINDPTKGTIIVSVLGAGGSGSGGVGVTAVPSSPANGAVALTSSPDPTDSEGCSYILRVSPGNYDVTVSRAGYVDSRQQATSTTTVSVTAGTSSTAQFQYDEATEVTLTYGPGVRVPTDLSTTFVGGVDAYVWATTVTSTSTTRTVDLHPLPAGYQAFAGTCTSADPEGWPDGVDGAGLTIVGQRSPAFATEPGDSVATAVPMGSVTVAAGAAASGRQLRAVSATPPTGSDDPGCASPETLVFGNTVSTRIPMGGTMTVALPFGSWTLEYYNGSSWVTVPASGLTPVTTGGQTGVSGTTTGVVTLDPRVVVP